MAVKITRAMRQLLQQYQDLLQIDPTQFLIRAEENYLSSEDIVNFTKIFDESNIQFDINQLFNSKEYYFKDKYFKKGSTESEIESSFYDIILDNPRLKSIVTEIPKEKFENLTDSEIHSAIKNSMICYKVGGVAGKIDRIYLQLFFNHDTYEIDLCVVIENNKGKGSAYYTNVETMGIIVPNYGFCVNEKELFKSISNLSENLISSLYIAGIKE